ncbi:hypothetical protein MLD38_039448 [Melastoma candidum]|uniref:Uncharacterized protein n=1 Tax=Melastoma candidum TaxID=119954 RepID=A0ACB9L3K8_9MYRT|nr:hypothetical protein MLD38_039448 [Melastoma candidum]
MMMDVVISVALLVVGIVALFVIHVCVVARLFGAGHRNGPLAHRPGAAQNSMVLSIEDVNRLPCFKYYAGGGSGVNGGGGTECAVCLETFKVGDVCRLLPNCGHSFHAHCIDSWLLKTPACPICRTRVEDNASPGVKEGSREESVVDSCSSSGEHVVLELASGR